MFAENRAKWWWWWFFRSKNKMMCEKKNQCQDGKMIIIWWKHKAIFDKQQTTTKKHMSSFDLNVTISWRKQQQQHHHRMHNCWNGGHDGHWILSMFWCVCVYIYIWNRLQSEWKKRSLSWPFILFYSSSIYSKKKSNRIEFNVKEKANIRTLTTTTTALIWTIGQQTIK